MKKNILLIVSLFLTFPFLWANEEKEPEKLLGVWWSDGGIENAKSKIKIYKKDGKYFGKIVWLKNPYEEDGVTEKRDTENPDPELKKRKILGLNLLKDFVYDERRERFEDGIIYNPEDGKTYSCYLEFEPNNKLKVRGFVGIALLGKTQIWTRDTEWEEKSEKKDK